MCVYTQPAMVIGQSELKKRYYLSYVLHLKAINLNEKFSPFGIKISRHSFDM